MKANFGTQLTDIIIQTIEGIIVQHGSATLEQINDELIVRCLELGFLDLLAEGLIRSFRFTAPPACILCGTVSAMTD